MKLPKGFLITGAACGIRRKNKKDLAVFYSTHSCTAVGTFTKNVVKAPSVILTQKRLKNPVRAVVVTSGNANCCTGARGAKDAGTLCQWLAERLYIPESSVLNAATGVIGEFLPMPKIKPGMDLVAADIRAGKSDIAAAVEGIMTTDTIPKSAQAALRVGGSPVHLWGCAKGAGMIHPAMAPPHATLLVFILSDVSAPRKFLQSALSQAVDSSFNCISVDGDMSTNDMVILLSNGQAGNGPLSAKEAKEFEKALETVCTQLAKQVVYDGEGATKVVEVVVQGARSVPEAKSLAEAVAKSPLVKTAFYGNDPNWGRIMASLGSAGVRFDPQRVEIHFDRLPVARRGQPLSFSEKAAKRIMAQEELTLSIHLHQGPCQARYFTCDMTFDYIRINASYRT